MSLISQLLSSTGTFDKLRKGHYDAESNCGWVKECEDVKNCIFNVCGPYMDAYGGAFYEGCVLKCNAKPNMSSIDDYLCDNPSLAYLNYGHTCPGYTPPKGTTFLILGREITLMQILIVIAFLALLFFIQQL